MATSKPKEDKKPKAVKKTKDAKKPVQPKLSPLKIEHGPKGGTVKHKKEKKK